MAKPNGNGATPLDPPSSPEIEQALIAAALLDPSVMPAVDGTVTPDDFYAQRHGWLWAAMRDLAERNSLDYPLLCRELETRNQLSEVGGDAFITDLLSRPVSILSAPAYAQVIADLAAKRRLVVGASQIVKAAYDGQTGATDVLAVAQSIVEGASRKAPAPSILSFGDVIGEVITEAQAPTHGLKTGFGLFDFLTGGLRPGELILIAARPSHGKTTLAMQMAFKVARQGVPVAVFSLEMRRVQLVQRLMAAIASVPAANIRDGHLSEQEWDRLTDWGARVSSAPLWIDDTPELTPADIRSRIMRLHDKPGLVVIDYIQLLRANEKAENRVQEIASVSRGVKAIAKTLGVPVLCAAQLNRQAEGRADGIPDLADLRESGQLEQDSDVVAFIHRPRMKDPASANDRAQIRIAKNRMGARGDFELAFSEPYVRFTDMERPQ